MEPNVYRTAIVGAGRIASGFDAPGSEHILTHAHAITKNPRLELVAITDIDAEKGKREAARWETNFSATTADLIREHAPEIIVIATSDETHADILLEALPYKPKLIVLEKPVSTTQEEASRIADAVTAAGIPVIVNFRRRFDDRVAQLANELRSGEHGAVISANAFYSKGILHTGSHLIDLARMLFGEFVQGTPFSQVRDWEGEPTVSGCATFEHCPQFSLTGGNERAYSIFELDILTEKRRLRFLNEGMVLETQEVIPDPIYAGFSILGDSHTQATGLLNAMNGLYTNAVRVLDGDEAPRCSLADALKADAVCRSLLSTNTQSI